MTDRANPDSSTAARSVGADAATFCSGCSVTFTCSMDEPGGCWCARLPVLPAAAVSADAGCLCEACLIAALARADDDRAARP